MADATIPKILVIAFFYVPLNHYLYRFQLVVRAVVRGALENCAQDRSDLVFIRILEPDVSKYRDMLTPNWVAAVYWVDWALGLALVFFLYRTLSWWAVAFAAAHIFLITPILGEAIRSPSHEHYLRKIESYLSTVRWADPCCDDLREYVRQLRLDSTNTPRSNRAARPRE